MEPDVLRAIEESFAAKSVEIVILESLFALPEPKMEAGEMDAWGEVLETLRTHDPDRYHHLVLLALDRCRHVIGVSALERCKMNAQAKNGCRRKAKKQAPAA